MLFTNEQKRLLKAFLDETRAGERPEVHKPARTAAMQVQFRAVVGYTPATIVDVSYYQEPISTDIYKAIGGDYVIVKASMGYGTDTKLPAHVANLRAAGIPYGLYHWFDPTSPTQNQLGILSRAINAHQPTSVWIDVEQIWSNWSKYWDYIYKRCSWNEVPKYTGAQIVFSLKRFMGALQERFPNMLIGIYTGKWFIDSYAPSLPSVMAYYLTWLAQYNPAYRGPANADRVNEIVRDAAGKNPVMPRGLDDWDIWQITSSISISGLTSGNIDFNISALPQEMFLEMMARGIIPAPEPASWNVEILAPASLRIREGPSILTKILGRLPYKSIVAVDRLENDWLHLADGRGWISKIWTKEV